MARKRPIGFTILALGLWWLAAAGFIGAAMVPEGIEVRAVSGIYGVAALVAGIALWQQKRWAPTAFAAWSCVVLAGGLVFDVILNLGPTIKGAAFIVVFGLLLWLLYRYVRARATAGA
jgi:uncharacterized membrane protein (DUF2068 family)